MDTTRRTLLAASAAVAAAAAAEQAYGQQPTGSREAAGLFYEKVGVHIHYQEVGSGFPLLLMPGGGLNSTMRFFSQGAPFNAIEEFKNEYRCVTYDLRNAIGGQSIGPLEIDRPWDAYADDHLGL